MESEDCCTVALGIGFKMFETTAKERSGGKFPVGA
jgi:hypothetical protein